ncbi:MAG TPA: hypothetical protein DCO72_10015 [Ruminococcus sp.]|nr:hypothetical protein [Ruminococcus sp.]
MKQKLKLNTLKRVKDESVRKHLSKQFPPDWEMEHIFEKSYQNYLKQSKTQEIPHFISVKRNQYMKVLVTVACVALTFGTFGMTLFLQRSAPELTNSTQHETLESTSFPSIAEIPETIAIHTDIAVISTNPVNSETNFPIIDEPEETAVPIISETTDPTEPVSTTAPPETDFITMELDTIPPTEQPSQSLPEPSEPLETISPTELLTSPQMPSESPAIAPVETIPENPPSNEPTQPETIQPAETVPPTESQDPTEPESTEPEDPPFDDPEPPMNSPTAPPDTTQPDTTEPPMDSGVQFKHPNGKLMITESEDGSRSIGYSWGENLTAQEIQQQQYEELKDFPNLQYFCNFGAYDFEVVSSYNLRFTNKDTEEVILVSHAPYWETYNKNIPENYRIEELSIKLKNAYVVAMPETTIDGVTDCLCTLIWDTGKSVGMISGLYSDLKKYINIAWSLYVY